MNSFVILVYTVGDSSGPKLDSMCRLDGCKRLKKKKSDGKSFYDYCCQEHATAAARNGKLG